MNIIPPGHEIADDHTDSGSEDPDQVNTVANNTSHSSLIPQSFASPSNVNSSNNFLRKTDPMPQHWVEDLRSVFTSVLDECSSNTGIQQPRSTITKRKTHDSDDDEPIFGGSISKQRKVSSKHPATRIQSNAVPDASKVNDLWREYSGNDRNEPLLGPFVVDKYLAGSIFIGYIVWLTVIQTNLRAIQMKHCDWNVIPSRLFRCRYLFRQKRGNSWVMWVITYKS